jgi:hypothetical protein
LNNAASNSKNKKKVDDPEKDRVGTGEVPVYKSSGNRTDKFSAVLMLGLLASCCFLVPTLLFIAGSATLAFPYFFYKAKSFPWSIVGLSFLLLVGLFFFVRSRKMKTPSCTEENQDCGKKPTTSNCDGEEKTRREVKELAFETKFEQQRL